MTQKQNVCYSKWGKTFLDTPSVIRNNRKLKGSVPLKESVARVYRSDGRQGKKQASNRIKEKISAYAG